MKYTVSVEGRDVEVEVEGDRLSIGGSMHEASLESIPGTPLSLLRLDGRPVTLALEPRGRGRWVVGFGGRRLDAEALDERTRHIRSLTGADAARQGGGVLKAPMPGLVVRIQVEVGQAVRQGEPLIVLEAMKMENQLKAPADGVVTEIRASHEVAVDKGQVLVVIAEASAAT